LDDAGARRLVAAILKQAHDDYISPKAKRNHYDAKKFINSAWCETLCEGIDIEHDEYIRACKKTIKLTEEEIRRKHYEKLKRELRLD